MPDRAAVLGYIHGGSVRAEFMASVVRALAGGAPVCSVLDVKSGPNLSRARNLLVRRFLATGVPWLWMTDTDMVFTPDALGRLLAAADPVTRPVVSALCFAERDGGGVVPTFYRRADDGFHPGAEWPEDDCLAVDAVGAGCLLVHRSAFTGIATAVRDDAAPWFRESVTGGQLVGEDLTFCLRAGQAGIPVHVCTGVRVGHVKSTILGKVC